MRKTFGLALVLVLAGCAKLPDAGTGTVTKRLIFKLTVQREINPNYVYIVALNPSTDPNPTTQGPTPVVAPPWGNGFVAGTVTHFVRWDPTQSPRYVIYRFRDLGLIDFFPIGTPINFVDVSQGGKTIQFEIDLSQIAPDIATANSYETMQVNFLTMDRVPQGSAGSKNWDALGDGRLPSQINQWVNIPLRTSGIYDNARLQDLEPTGDAPDPDLDISDWSVEVRLQQ